jgi:hypothetical protein
MLFFKASAKVRNKSEKQRVKGEEFASADDIF